MLVPGPLECSTQALRATTLEEKGERETLGNNGTGTEPKKVTRSLSQGTTVGPPHTVGQLQLGLLQL